MGPHAYKISYNAWAEEFDLLVRHRDGSINSLIGEPVKSESVIYDLVREFCDNLNFYDEDMRDTLLDTMFNVWIQDDVEDEEWA